MTSISTYTLYGERISKLGQLRLGCSALLFDKNRTKVLLTRRKDNGMWCLPGGMIEAGEAVSEACVREVWEETSLQVHVTRLTGVYSDPNQVVVYPDGNKAHVVVLAIEVTLINGKASLSAETTGVDWFPVRDAIEMELFHDHARHIIDAIAGQDAAYLR